MINCCYIAPDDAEVTVEAFKKHVALHFTQGQTKTIVYLSLPTLLLLKEKLAGVPRKHL